MNDNITEYIISCFFAAIAVIIGFVLGYNYHSTNETKVRPLCIERLDEIPGTIHKTNDGKFLIIELSEKYTF